MWLLETKDVSDSGPLDIYEETQIMSCSHTNLVVLISELYNKAQIKILELKEHQMV